MATGHQLRVLFVTILIDCSPTHPRQLWDDHKHSLCDDLRRNLQHRHIRENPSNEDVWDYGLFLISTMPQVQQEWAAAVQNPLIAHEQDYNAKQQTQLAEQRIPLLNHDQRSAFDLIMQARSLLSPPYSAWSPRTVRTVRAV